MKYTVLAAVAALVAGTAATAHAENARSGYGASQPANSDTSSEFVASKADPQIGSNAASLKALLAEWDQAGFNAPSKPAQYRVYGRNGYVTSGPIVSQIRSAMNDARQDRDRAEATDIARARSLLAGSAMSTTAGASG